jgi:hypothetical protein
MVLIPPINPYVASQVASQQARPAVPNAQHVVTAKPPTPPEKRERMRDKEKQHRKAEQDVEDEVQQRDAQSQALEDEAEKRGRLTDIKA